MKHKLLTIVIASLLLLLMVTPTFAETAGKDVANVTVEIEYFSDGSYAIIETTEDTYTSSRASTSTKSASRTYTYYNQDKVKAWDFTLKGSFSYNGSSAKATSASSSYNIYVSGWKCSSRDGTTSGAIAKANGTFKYLTLTKTTSLGLKCSPSGAISAA